VRETTVRRTRVTSVGEDIGTDPETRTIATHARDVARDAQRVINSIPEGAAKSWFAHLVDLEPSKDVDAIRIRCAATLRVPGVRAQIESTATDWVKEQLNAHHVAILNTTGQLRDGFRRVQEQTSSPETVTVDLRLNERAATKDRDGADLPLYVGHLYADADGLFPLELNDWERKVIGLEIARPNFVAWYRNPGSATPASLRIAYQTEAGEWASLQPDFIIVSRRDDGSLAASIVDPHGDYLADAGGKLQALASFAESHGDAFIRIESVAKGDDGLLRVLDLSDGATRIGVAGFGGGKVSPLYNGARSRRYA
jgi:type III restriction enzyme